MSNDEIEVNKKLIDAWAHFDATAQEWHVVTSGSWVTVRGKGKTRDDAWADALRVLNKRR